MSRIVKKPDIRRQELLDIGIKLFFEAGGKGVSIQEVVKQAEVATGLFYYYFKSKDEFLDEALNYYIQQEIAVFEAILKDQKLTAWDKLEAVLTAFFNYAEKMAPLRSSAPFRSEYHYALTEKLISQLKKGTENVLTQGLSENVFHVNNVSITAGFILNGLICVFDENTEINKDALDAMKNMVYKILKG